MIISRRKTSSVPAHLARAAQDTVAVVLALLVPGVRFEQACKDPFLALDVTLECFLLPRQDGRIVPRRGRAHV